MGSNTPAYRLLACDLDGTLIGDDLTISPRVRKALAEAQARGVHVTLATGRGFREALPFARSLNITQPIICYQGGVIKHPLTSELFYRAKMERALALQVIELAQRRNWHLVLYIDDSVYVQEFRHPRGFYEALLGSNIECVTDLNRVVATSGSYPAKVLFVAEEAESDRIQAEMNSRFGRHMNVVRSHSLFVEGNPLGVDKGDALRRLAKYLGVPQARVMAIGDQGNDVSMLAWAGLGVAMGNGSEAVRAVADWKAPPLSADGAAVAIELFLSNNHR